MHNNLQNMSNADYNTDVNLGLPKCAMSRLKPWFEYAYELQQNPEYQ